MRIALISGSFDPPTMGHLDLIKRARELFNEVVVCIFRNSEKQYLFTEKERLAMLSAMIAEAKLTFVRVDVSAGFVADYAQIHDIGYVVRGVRNADDMEYEIEMARYNKKRNPNLETLLLVAPSTFSGISSTEVRKRLKNQWDLYGLLPESVRILVEDAWKRENPPPNEIL